MSATDTVLDFVRQRAGFACEYCGVTEVDSGGKLTVDHFQPKSYGGSDALDNLVYSCGRCNLYKHDFWSTDEGGPRLWNPRKEALALHFIELDDGLLHPLTDTGQFTLQRLRLNRPQLITRRLDKRNLANEATILSQLKSYLLLYENLVQQQQDLIQEQQRLLQEQQLLIQQITRQN